jgi:hypothetical protein
MPVRDTGLPSGPRLSALHNHFLVSIRDKALDEARSLTAEKVNLASIGPGAPSGRRVGARPHWQNAFSASKVWSICSGLSR